MERSIIVITGPTCSGKTALGIELGQALNGEIISADSRQIYKFLDIGTAKPTTAELEKVIHHFISELKPDKDYNASKFENDAMIRIEEIYSRNKIPIVVGGSGLYIKALVEGIVDTPGKDEEFRKKLLSEKEKFGNAYLLEKLKKIDPESSENIHPSFWKRIIRALEVYHLTGKKISQFHSEQNTNRKYKFKKYVLDWKRDVLYKNIEDRVDKMIEKGLVDEVEGILDKGYSPRLNSLNTVGYKEIISYLNKEISMERAIELIKRNTRRFAKRQLTWFRSDKNNTWLSIENKNSLKEIMKTIFMMD